MKTLTRHVKGHLALSIVEMMATGKVLQGKDAAHVLQAMARGDKLMLKIDIKTKRGRDNEVSSVTEQSI